MPIDINRLLKFEIPVVRQVLEPRDIAFYALSTGMGRDPLDARQLEFVDPLRGPAALPTMVLVMAHPGFYLSDPRSGVDPKAVIHLEQSIEILGTVPNRGVVQSRTHITNVVDKGEGKAALIYAQTELTNETGVIFARLNRTTFIRGGGGFGGAAQRPSEADETVLFPETGPDSVVAISTNLDQALVYRLNGDLNPLHSDPDIAMRAGFERPILHGLCSMGIVFNAILQHWGLERVNSLRSMRLRFSRPVYPGETIETEIWQSGHFRARIPSRDITVIDAGLVVFDPANSSGTHNDRR